MRKIVNIIVFAVAIIVAILSVAFVVVFNEDKAMYAQVELIDAQSPEMIADFQAATAESLPQFIATYQEKGTTLSESLKVAQYPNEVLYTYICNLKEVTEDSFEQFKADFPHYADVLFAKVDEKQEYADGFAKVQDFAALDAYINELEAAYAPRHQEYLSQKDYVKAVNGFVSQASLITENVSQSKQQSQLDEMQAAVKSAKCSASLLNFAVILCYLLFGVAFAMLVYFAIFKLCKNIKTSYKGLIVVVVAAILIYVLYAVSPAVMTPSAIKMQHSVGELKWINAGVITCYIALFGAILSVVATWVINLLKK